MQFTRPNCEQCVCEPVCSLKTDVSLFKNDLEQMKYTETKMYVDRLSDLTVKIECRHFRRDTGVVMRNRGGDTNAIGE